MATPILTTKLNIPLLRPQRVARQRLIDRLNQGLAQACTLTLVSAPAGFGKTTLLAAWVNQTAMPTAWLSLDQRDNAPSRFWAAFTAALQRLNSGISLSDLSDPANGPDESTLEALINQIEAWSESLVLILEDYHSIDNPIIHSQLAFTLENLPHKMRLVISTRSDPPLPLSRLRGRGRLNELRADDLRFTLPEAAAFLTHVMGLQLEEQELAALQARTEGWAVGLQMAGLSLQGCTEGEIHDFIAGFTGSQRFIFDYLLGEVLLRQPQERRDFLLQTCLLDRLTAPLCEAVTGQPDGQESLQSLEADNLFLFPLDDERRWYRYHPLFADVLRQRLSGDWPELIPTLNSRASQWFQQNGFTLDAMKHALEAGEAEQVARLVGSNAFTLMEFSDLSLVVNWLNRLDQDEVRASAWLCLAQAWLAAFTGRLDQVEGWLGKAQLALVSSPSSPEPIPVSSRSEREMRAYCTAVRSYVSGVKGRPAEGIESLQTVLQDLPEDDPLTRSWALASLAIYRLRQGDVQAGIRNMQQAAALSQESGSSHIHVMVLSNLAVFETIGARLQEAAHTYRQALRIAGEYSSQTGQELPVAGYAYTYLGGILLEWDEIESAINYIDKGIRLCERWGEPQLLSGAYMRLAELRAALGDLPGALQTIQKVKRAGGRLSPQFASRGDSFEAWLHLKSGDLQAAAQWASRQEMRLKDRLDLSSYADDSLTLAAIELAKGQAGQALDRLALLIEITEAAGALHYVVKSLVLQAVAQWSQGEAGLALESLERCLVIARPQGYKRTFLALGAPMQELLRQAANRGLYQEYTRELLETFQRQAIRNFEGHTEASPDMIAPLTPRESQVLRLLAARRTRPEVARELFISENTARTHIKNIYRKLGAHSRQQALQRARKFGLI